LIACVRDHKPLDPAGYRALCDAAEAGLRAKRYEAESSAGAPINEGGQDAAVGNEAGRGETGRVVQAPASPSPDVALVERLRWEASNRGLPPFDGWGWLSKAADAIERLTAELAERTRERDDAWDKCDKLAAMLDL
jgi:hypothetical protein